MLASVAAVDPLPFVPAISTDGNRFCGLSSQPSSARISASVNFRAGPFAGRRTGAVGLPSCCGGRAGAIARQAGHRSTEPAHTLALAALELDPILDLRMRLGEGTGATLALPVLRAAVATLSSMATFTQAGVSTRPDDAPGPAAIP